jgi:hypothetical protein
MSDPNERIINRRELLLGGGAVVLAVAITAIVLTMNGFSSDAEDSGLPTPSPSPSPTASPEGSGSPAASPGTETTAATQGSGEPFSPAAAAEERLVELARDSVNLLPAGRWPELYDDFVVAFQERCTAEEFAQAGEDGAAALGSDLELINFVRLQDLMIADDTATGVIVGELRGKSEYTIQAAFLIEAGAWKLAPAPGTSGCSAFNRLAG